MEIIYWNQIKNSLDNDCYCPIFTKPCGITIGSFDGIHKGHRKLLNCLIENCNKKNLQKGVVTFVRPLPSIKHKDDYTGDILTLEQRLKIFEKFNIDFVILVDFSNEFASLKGIEFLQILLDTCNMKFIAEGVDFRCGYKGSTDTTAIKYFAKNNNISCEFVDSVYYKNSNFLDDENNRVSSSFIRQMIKKRCFSVVTELLTVPYTMEFELKENFENKTCNLETTINKSSILQVIPPDGVYNVNSYLTFCEEKKCEKIDTRVEILEDKIFVLLYKFNQNKNVSKIYIEFNL